MVIKKNSKILFQGDSVTDCKRDRNDEFSLGSSYVKKVYEYLKNYNIKVINKAISGNRVNDLLDRFENDFKNIQPNYLILLIGVNDTWHNYPNSKDNLIFEKEYDLLLSKIYNEMNCEVMILEPFIIGFKEEITQMKNDLFGKIKIIKKLALKYNCAYLSFAEDFSKVVSKDNEDLYSVEGIHPLELGYELMANKIIENLKIL